MEISTIIGIILACLTMLIGAYWLFRPAKDDAEANTMLNVHTDSQLPIIPRHLRSRLVGNKRPATQLDNSGDALPPAQHSEPDQQSAQLAFNLEQLEQRGDVTDSNALSTNTLFVSQPDAHNTDTTTSAQSNQATQMAEPLPHSDPATSTRNTPDDTSNPFDAQQHVIEDAVQVSAFEGQSNLLDEHLSEQQRRDSEADIANADHVITLKVMANPRRALSGDKALKTMLKYGLRYGELSCFHRHEEPNQDSPLMFSVLRITDFGYAGFDLETLSSEQVQGLALFMTFPHAKALTGFDMMSSIAHLIASEIDGRVFDETHREYTPQLKLHWRNHVIDYMAQHPN